MATSTDRRSLYPAIEPYNSGYLMVSDNHELYYEECGNPQGKPAVLLHGGPGGGCSPSMRSFYNPDVYRIVLFDQRGCGRSRPHASLEDNTTWDLVRDIELLRKALQIERWQVFGGSWGSTLALAYAETHPEVVTELVIRGIFLGRRKEQDWIYVHGANQLYPTEWREFVAPIPEDERHDMAQAYYDRLMASDGADVQELARKWSVWEAKTSCLLPNDEIVRAMGSDRLSVAIARIECHYFVNDCFFEENQLLRDAGRLADIPTVIVNGRYDVLCPPVSAWELSVAMPHAELRLAPDAGHSAFEPGIIDELVQATDRFA